MTNNRNSDELRKEPEEALGRILNHIDIVAYKKVRSDFILLDQALEKSGAEIVRLKEDLAYAEKETTAFEKQANLYLKELKKKNMELTKLEEAGDEPQDNHETLNESEKKVIKQATKGDNENSSSRNTR